VSDSDDNVRLSFDTFEELVRAWLVAAESSAEAQADYQRAHSRAVMNSTGKSADRREADARLVSVAARLDADCCKAEAQALRFMIEHALAQTRLGNGSS